MWLVFKRMTNKAAPNVVSKDDIKSLCYHIQIMLILNNCVWMKSESMQELHDKGNLIIGMMDT